MAFEFWKGENSFVELLLTLVVNNDFSSECWTCSPYREDQIFLKTQQESVQLFYLKQAYMQGTCCAAGALPSSQAELTCTAKLKDNLKFGKGLRKV